MPIPSVRGGDLGPPASVDNAIRPPNETVAAKAGLVQYREIPRNDQLPQHSGKGGPGGTFAGSGQPRQPLHQPLHAGAPPAPPFLGSNDVVADKSTLTWVNVLLGWIWPKANTALIQWVHDDLTPRLQDALAKTPFSRAHFSKFTLGNNTPEFGPIEVIRHSDTHVEVALEMRYISDVDICLDAGTGGISLGIDRLTFSGRLILMLQPLMTRWPIIGAMKMFFPALPKVTLRFNGLAAVAHIPAIEEKIQKSIDDWMMSGLVLPNRKVWLYTHNEDLIDYLDVCSMAPLGVLRGRVIRGRNLAGVNWQALDSGRFTSDPYCMMRLGAWERRSTTVRGSTDPVWPPQEPSVYFTVHHRDQQLEIDVIGEDQGGLFGGKRNFTALLGSMPETGVGKILTEGFSKDPPSPTHAAPGPPGSNHNLAASLGASERAVKFLRVPLDTTKVSKDMLHMDDPVNRGIPSELDLEVEWFDLVDASSSAPLRRLGHPAMTSDPVALLLVDIYKGVGFPTEANVKGPKGGLRWRTRCEAQSEGDGDLQISRKGELCDVEELEFPDLPIHPRLFEVIERLIERDYTVPDIATIVGADSPEIITLYLQQKQEYLQKYQEREHAQQKDDHRVNLQWYEVLTHFIRRPETASLTLELIDAEDRIVGEIGPLPLRQLLGDESAANSAGATLRRRAAYTLNATVPETEPGGLGAWFAPSRSQTKPLDPRRFYSVELQLAARLKFLAPSRVAPKAGASEFAEAASVGVLPIPA